MNYRLSTGNWLAYVQPVPQDVLPLLTVMRQTPVATDGQLVVQAQVEAYYSIVGDVLCTPVGLLTRLLAGLHQAGHQVAHVARQIPLLDRPATSEPYALLRVMPQKRPPTADYDFLDEIVAPSDREFLDAIIATTRGQVIVQDHGTVPRLMALVCMLYPDARILIPADSRARVDSLRQRLQDWLAEPVHAATHKDRQWGTCRIVVSNLQTYADAYEAGWDIVMYPCHRESIHHANVEGNMLCCDATQRYAFVLAQTRLNNRAQLRLEVASGPVVYRQPIRPAARPVEVHIARSTGAPVPPTALQAANLTACERKRLLVWANDARNRYIATVAQAFADSDLATLQSHGLLLDEPEYWFHHEGLQRRVTILVDVLEHAQRLQEHLPHWQLRTLAPGTLAEQQQRTKLSDFLLPSPTIIATSVYAQKCELHTDVMIRADGTGSPWDRNYGPYEHEQDLPLVIIDVLAAYDTQAEQDALCRLRDYDRLGWHVTGVLDKLPAYPNPATRPARANKTAHKQHGKPVPPLHPGKATRDPVHVHHGDTGISTRVKKGGSMTHHA